MPNVTRTNGNTVATSVYGLTPRYLKIEIGNVNFGNIADTANVSYYGKPYSNYEKTLFALATEASIITAGKPTAAGNVIVVQVDNTYGAVTGLANSTVTTSNVAAAIRSALTADQVTITESAGFSADGFAAFS